MQMSTTPPDGLLQFRQKIEKLLRQRVLEAIEIVLEEEVTQGLGVSRHERDASRNGYRNGSKTRLVTTEYGPRELTIPRARLVQEDGTSSEFQSKILPRYQRRTKAVDEAILGCYLAGANSRRIRKALSPLLGDEHLSKSSISRVVGRLKKLFASWQGRDLSEEQYPIVFLDGFHLKVRMARRVVSVPVLAALGVAEDGSKRLISLQLVISESSSSWREFVEDLSRRGLVCPQLLVTDGHKGLGAARKAWPDAKVQRCTVHKKQNLLEKAPKHVHNELRRDYSQIIGAKDGEKARLAHRQFLAKWETLCPAVARSLEEAGLDLLTFYEFPKDLWKGIRSTNSLENLNREFRRRTKTQASFTTEESALTLLFALVAFGQIRMRKISGHREVAKLVSRNQEVAA
jgi:transposase-like protein